MGRYLERADQSARYIKVHYYSALDAPLASKHEFIFESILTMLGMIIGTSSIMGWQAAVGAVNQDFALLVLFFFSIVVQTC